MIATLKMPPPQSVVVRSPREVVGLLGDLRAHAAREVATAFDGISGKRINTALLPGITRHSISRATNGCESNPLFRLAGWFVLARRCGVPKYRLQRLVDWLQAALDAAYADQPRPSLHEVMEKETEVDAAEDPPQMRAACGDRDALHVWLDKVLERHSFDRTVIETVSAELWFTNRAG